MLDSGKWVHMLRNSMYFSTTLQCWAHMLRNSWPGALYSLFFALLFSQYVNHLYGICDKMVDYRRIFYLLKSPDFVRKVGGHAPDYPESVINGK